MNTTVQASADDVLGTPRDEAVALWNPTAAALWSLLFTPAFGAWLVMRNWERLGQPDKLRQSRYWFAGTLLFCLGSYVAAGAGVLLACDDLNVPWWVELCVFAFWCALSAYPQISHVDDRHGETYARRSWAAPLVIALAANCAIPFGVDIVVGYQAAAAGATAY